MTLVINKIDLVTEEEKSEIYNQVLSWNYKPILISVSENLHMKEVIEKITNHISVVMGPSGKNFKKFSSIIQYKFNKC